MSYGDYIKFHSNTDQNILTIAKERHELYKDYKANSKRIIEINKTVSDYYNSIDKELNYYMVENLRTTIGEKYKSKNNLDVIIRMTMSAIKNYKLKNYTVANYILYIQHMSGILDWNRYTKIMKQRYLSHGAATELLNTLIIFTNTLCSLTNESAEKIRNFLESQNIVVCEVIELTEDSIYLKFINL